MSSELIIIVCFYETIVSIQQISINQYSGLFHYYSLRADTGSPGMLHARLCQAFLVGSDYDYSSISDYLE